jgi:hypothetical protein
MSSAQPIDRSKTSRFYLRSRLLVVVFVAVMECLNSSHADTTNRLTMNFNPSWKFKLGDYPGAPRVCEEGEPPLQVRRLVVKKATSCFFEKEFAWRTGNCKLARKISRQNYETSPFRGIHGCFDCLPG